MSSWVVLAESEPEDWMGLEWAMASMSWAETISDCTKQMMMVMTVEICFIEEYIIQVNLLVAWMLEICHQIQALGTVKGEFSVA